MFHVNLVNALLFAKHVIFGLMSVLVSLCSYVRGISVMPGELKQLYMLLGPRGDRIRYFLLVNWLKGLLFGILLENIIYIITSCGFTDYYTSFVPFYW